MESHSVLVGCGNMGRALLRGLAVMPQRGRISVIDPKADMLAKEYAGAGKNDGIHFLVAPESPGPISCLILAIKPQKFAEILPQYARALWADSLVVSIAAGVEVQSIRQLLKGFRGSIVRAMPNLPGIVGQGVTALYAEDGIGADKKAMAEELMRPLGACLWVEQESWMHPITALSGSGPAYFYALCEAMIQAGVSQGLPPALALDLAAHSFYGSAALMKQANMRPGDLRAQVTSKGGTTEAALDILSADSAFSRLITEAINAATRRAKALSLKS